MLGPYSTPDDRNRQLALPEINRADFALGARYPIPTRYNGESLAGLAKKLKLQPSQHPGLQLFPPGLQITLERLIARHPQLVQALAGIDPQRLGESEPTSRFVHICRSGSEGESHQHWLCEVIAWPTRDAIWTRLESILKRRGPIKDDPDQIRALSAIMEHPITLYPHFISGNVIGDVPISCRAQLKKAFEWRSSEKGVRAYLVENSGPSQLSEQHCWESGKPIKIPVLPSQLLQPHEVLKQLMEGVQLSIPARSTVQSDSDDWVARLSVLDQASIYSFLSANPDQYLRSGSPIQIPEYVRRYLRPEEAVRRLVGDTCPEISDLSKEHLEFSWRWRLSSVHCGLSRVDCECEVRFHTKISDNLVSANPGFIVKIETTASGAKSASWVLLNKRGDSSELRTLQQLGAPVIIQQDGVAWVDGKFKQRMHDFISKYARRLNGPGQAVGDADAAAFKKEYDLALLLSKLVHFDYRPETSLGNEHETLKSFSTPRQPNLVDDVFKQLAKSIHGVTLPNLSIDRLSLLPAAQGKFLRIERLGGALEFWEIGRDDSACNEVIGYRVVRDQVGLMGRIDSAEVTNLINQAALALGRTSDPTSTADLVASEAPSNPQKLAAALFELLEKPQVYRAIIAAKISGALRDTHSVIRSDQLIILRHSSISSRSPGYITESAVFNRQGELVDGAKVKVIGGSLQCLDFEENEQGSDLLSTVWRAISEQLERGNYRLE